MLAIAAALPIVVAFVLFPVGLEKWLGAGVLFDPTILEVLLILFGRVLLSRITAETSNRRLISAMMGCAPPNAWP